jgi:hypothetical protein
VLNFNYIIIFGIYLLNNVKFNSKYDTRCFQNLIKQKLHDKSILYFAGQTNIHLKKLRQTLKTVLYCGEFKGIF